MKKFPSPPPKNTTKIVNSVLYFFLIQQKTIQAGQLDVFTDKIPGIPDGIALASDGGFWVAVPTPVSKVRFLVETNAMCFIL